MLTDMLMKLTFICVLDPSGPLESSSSFLSLFFTQKAHLAQLVGAEEAEHNVVDAHAFLEGLCGECLEEHESIKAVTLEDIAHTEEEALNLVS